MMRRTFATIAALVALALALGFGCMRVLGPRTTQPPAANPQGETSPAKAQSPSPALFDALIDPRPETLFAALPDSEEPLPVQAAAAAAVENSQAPEPKTPETESAPRPEEQKAAAQSAPAPSAASAVTAAPESSGAPHATQAEPDKTASATPETPHPAKVEPASVTPAAKPLEIASAAPVSPSPAPQAGADAPKSIMVAGDSFAVGVGMSLAEELRGTGIALSQRGKTSSGLNSPRFYDWNAALEEFLAKEKPDALVVMLGANDAQNGSGSSSWADEFSAKTGKFIEIAAKAGARVYWVGLPPMRDDKLTAKVKTANEAMKKACDASADCFFIESWDLFCDESGAFVRKKVLGGKTVTLRGKDGVHMTMSGYKALGDKILDKCSGKREISLKE